MHIKDFYRFLLESESTRRVFGDHVEWRNPQGNLHREDGPAVEYTDGTKEWFLDGQRHRLDGPAVEWADGTKAWWVDDQLHRLDGPAVEHADGRKEWWLDGWKISEVDFWQRTPLSHEELDRALRSTDSEEIAQAIAKNPNFDLFDIWDS